MSIIPLNKVTVYGMSGDQQTLLAGLQQLGCMHLIPLQSPGEAVEADISPLSEEAYKAWRYLMNVRRRRHQVLDPDIFDLEQVVSAALANKQARREAEDRCLFLNNRLRELKPWGHFTLPDLDALAGQRLWFYKVPHPKAESLQTLELPWQQVGEDQRFLYIVVVSPEEPPANALPVARTRAGAISPEDLSYRLRQAEIQLEDVEAEHESLSRWIDLLGQNLAQAEDQTNLNKAAQQTSIEDGIVMVQGWMPERDLGRLQNFTAQQGLAYLAEPPQPDEEPPTLLENPMELKGGEALVTFYETPGYRTWDPSTVVFFSFAVFFAMILADAGYALLLLAGLAYLWKRLGNTTAGRSIRIYAAVLLGTSVIYGIMIGSYFGINPGVDSLLGTLKILDLNDFQSMMQLSLIIGCLHLALANGVLAYRIGSFPANAKPLGWLGVIFAAIVLILTSGAAPWQNLAIGVCGAGIAVIVLFTGTRKVDSLPSLLIRLFQGVSGLTNFTKLFGDILSYLRLFALGLATGSLALTFNNLAQQVIDGVPVLGLLLGLLILLLGHAITLGMGILACFVHGVRLNVIEFFNWGLPVEGYPFHAFASKERLNG